MDERPLQLRIGESQRTLLAAAAALPKEEEILSLMERFAPALERGYFQPDEDEEIRALFARYLRVRASLHSLIQELRPLFDGKHRGKEISSEQLKAFAVAWTAAQMLMRAAHYAVDHFHPDPLIRAKLDEAEPRFGIPRKQLTLIYRSATAPRTLYHFFRAMRFEQAHRRDIDALQDDPAMWKVLNLLEAERPFLTEERRQHLRKRIAYRIDRILSRPAQGYQHVMFGLFEVSGRAIAEMRNPFHHKRVNPAVLRQLETLLQPGDVFITRHDDALSNLFLPGFWPHVAMVIGTEAQREALGVESDAERQERASGTIRMLEAKKDGVLFRQLEETLQVDAFVLLRPRELSDGQRRQAIERAMTHEGKLYDFEFDFKRADRLVCTEVVYRAYHGIGGLFFQLRKHAGRFCFTAEDLLDEAVIQGRFEVVALFGVRGNRLLRGEKALRLAARSYGRSSYCG